MKNLHIKLLNENAKLPVRATDGSVGFDIAACIDEIVCIEPGETKMIGSGFAISLPTGYAAFIYTRSSLGSKFGIVPANCVGVIDSDYRGEIRVVLRNFSTKPFIVKDGDRIAQMVITRCETPKLVICQELDETKRGDGGFGSTG